MSKSTVKLTGRTGFQVAAARRFLGAEETTTSTITWRATSAPTLITAIDGLLATDPACQGRSGHRVALQSLRRALLAVAEVAPLPEPEPAPAKKAPAKTAPAAKASTGPNSTAKLAGTPRDGSEGPAHFLMSAHRKGYACRTCGEFQKPSAFPTVPAGIGVPRTRRQTQCRTCRDVVNGHLVWEEDDEA